MVLKTKDSRLKPKKQKALHMTVTRAKAHFCLTDSMIKEIGDPDLILPNPHYKTAAPMRLYLIERLEDWVTHNFERVEKARQRREKLSAIQRGVHEKKRAEMYRLAEAWEPKFVDKLPRDVIDRAYTFYSFNYEDFTGQLTKRGLIAFIRHQYTNYEAYLAKIPEFKGKTGNHLLYLILREKVDKMIEIDCKEVLKKVQ